MKSNKQVTAATMKDVALKAKVSTATVSRALMNPDKVSQSTRSRVEQAALEVGYFPQSMGRNVKRNESRTILVIVPDICDPFFSEIIRGIEVTAAEQGYLVLIGDCAHQNQKEKTFLNLIITKQIDGMVLLSSRLPFDASVEEQRNLPPMVMSNEFAPELELPTVHIRRVQRHELPVRFGPQADWLYCGAGRYAALSLSLTRLRTGIKTQWHCGRSALHRPWRLYL